MSGDLRWMSRSSTSGSAIETCSSVDSSAENVSKKLETDTYSDRNSSMGSEASDLAFHTLLVETRSRDLEREVFQDPDSNSCLFSSESIFDNAADGSMLIAVSKRSVSLLPLDWLRDIWTGVKAIRKDLVRQNGGWCRSVRWAEQST